MDHSIRIRPQRKGLRWHSHDYSADAAYFVTVCTLDGRCVFGDVAGVMRDAAGLARYRKYIADNPARWSTGEENPVRLHSQRDPLHRRAR